jgi:hypothetical protein
VELARDLLKAGVTIITTLPQDTYTPESLHDTVAMVKLQLYFDRAHEESLVKSARIKERWAQHRLAMRAKKVVSKRLPFWVSVEDGRLVLNAKAAWVQAAYRMAAQGAGYAKITRHFNANGWRVRRAKTVDDRLIRNLLGNRQTLGELQPRTFWGSCRLADRPPDGDVIENYFPAAVTPELFHQAQGALAARKVVSRGRSGADANTRNLFKGLLWDLRHPDSPVYQTTKPGPRLYLTPWHALQGLPGTRVLSFRYEVFERVVLKACKEVRPRDLLGPATDLDQELADCDARLAEVAAKADRAKARLRTAKDADHEEVLVEQLAALKAERKALEKEREALHTRRATEPADHLESLHTCLDALERAEDKEDMRHRIRLLLGSLVRRIDVGVQALSYRRRRCYVRVCFKTGLYRKIVMDQDGTSVTMPDDNPELNLPEL